MSTSVDTDASAHRAAMDRALASISMSQAWESFPDMLLLVQRRTAIVAANPAACTELGYDLDSLLQLDIDDLIPESSRVNHRQYVDNYYSEAAGDGESSSQPMVDRGRLECRRADGSTFSAAISLIPVGGSTESVLVRASSIDEWIARELVSQSDKVAREIAEERLRIARDIHDDALQELISIGMLLRSLHRSLGPEAARNLNNAINSLEDTTKKIRNTIFNTDIASNLIEPMSVQLGRLVANTRVRSGCEVNLTVSSDVDTRVPEFTTEHAVAVTSEALSNASRHSSATRIDVDVYVVADRVAVIVTDNGTGIPADLAHSSGLANMDARAKLCEGYFSHADNPGGGTILKWSVPLHPKPLPRTAGGSSPPPATDQGLIPE